MARLSGTILSDDESFKAQLGNLLRLSAVPVLVADGGNPDIAVVDGRSDVSGAVALVERHGMLRTVFPAGARPPVQQELPPALRTRAATNGR